MKERFLYAILEPSRRYASQNTLYGNYSYFGRYDETFLLKYDNEKGISSQAPKFDVPLDLNLNQYYSQEFLVDYFKRKMPIHMPRNTVVLQDINFLREAFPDTLQNEEAMSGQLVFIDATAIDDVDIIHAAKPFKGWPCYNVGVSFLGKESRRFEIVDGHELIKLAKRLPDNLNLKIQLAI